MKKHHNQAVASFNSQLGISPLCVSLATILLARGTLRGASIRRSSLLSGGAASRARTARPQTNHLGLVDFRLRPRPFFSTSTASAMATPTAPAATITHILFDMDGLLLDTESAYTDAQRQVLEAIEPGLGASFTWELKSQMMGRTSLAAGQVLVDALDLQNKHKIDAAEFIRRREEVLSTLLPHTKAMPGAARLVEHLKKSGVPSAVATSSHRAHFELKSKNHGGIFENFEHVVTGCAVRCVREMGKKEERKRGRERERRQEKKLLLPLSSSLATRRSDPLHTHGPLLPSLNHTKSKTIARASLTRRFSSSPPRNSTPHLSTHRACSSSRTLRLASRLPWRRACGACSCRTRGLPGARRTTKRAWC